MKRIFFLLFVITACIGCKTQQEPEVLNQVESNQTASEKPIFKVPLSSSYLFCSADSDAYYRRDFEDHMNFLAERSTDVPDGLFEKADAELENYYTIFGSQVLSGIETYFSYLGTQEELDTLQHAYHPVMVAKLLSVMTFSSGGFAIFFNDNRSPIHLLCYSPQGTFDPDYFTSYNEMTGVIVDSLLQTGVTNPDGVIRRVISNGYNNHWADMVNFKVFIKSMFDAIPNGYIPCHTHYFPGYWHTTNNVDWFQTYPYNQCCSDSRPTGTIPLAIAKILTHLGYEENINGNTFPSSSFVYGQNMDKLYPALGYFYTQVQSTYHYGVTEGSTSAGLTLLHNLGIDYSYYTAGNYTFDTITDELGHNRLVIAVRGKEWYVIVGALHALDCLNEYTKLHIDFNGVYEHTCQWVHMSKMSGYDIILCDY